MQQRPNGKPKREISHRDMSRTACRNPIRRTLREDGVSEAVGAMLLITIVAMGISIFVAGVVLQPVVSDPPAFTVNVSYGSGGEVYIRHIGGESVSKDLLHVYIDTGATVEDVQPLLEISSETTWTEWHIGDTLVYTPDTPLTEPPEVAMIYADQSGAQYLYYASYNWTGAIPAATPGVPPTADFTANPRSGDAPLTIQFTDTSTGGAREWSWAFGDGGTSTLRHPTHTYAVPGTYAVSLTAGNAFGSDIEEKAGYITVNAPPPAADFSAAPTSGTAPLTVQFTDTSTNVPTSWAWTFGDGETSTLQNPSHTYAAAGTYTVTLTATNPGGSDTETKVSYVTVTEIQPPTVTSTTPGSGKSGTIVSITNLAGTNFRNGATVKLTKSGEPEIHATGVTVVSSTQITCSFNLAGASTGQWNVIVANPDAQSDTLSNGFEVTTAQIYEPEPDLNDELAHWTKSGSIGVPTSGSDDVIQMTGDSNMYRTLSTVGYENIQVSFSLAAIEFKNKDEAFVEWFDGTSWNKLLHIHDKDPLGDIQFHDFSDSLLPSADNNPSFAIRFRLIQHGGTVSVLVDLKNLEITGDPN